MGEIDQNIHINEEDVRLLWQLACALLPTTDWNFSEAFALAVSKRSSLLGNLRGEGIFVAEHPGAVIRVRRDDAGFWLVQNPKS